VAPDVTVVIPTRDRPQLLAQTLRSVLRQEGVVTEVIVVDDGSKDPAAITALPEVASPSVSILRNDISTGVAAARNRGIERAGAEWVATLDDDDLWSPHKLRLQLRAVETTGRAWAFGGAVHFLPGPRPWLLAQPPAAEQVAQRLPHDNLVPAGSSNVLMRRDAIEGLGGFDVTLRHLADWDVWCKLLRLSAPATIADFVVAYRLHDANMVLQSSEGFLDEADVIERRTEDLRNGEPMNRSALHRWVATMHMRAGRRAEARRAYRQAFHEGDRAAILRVARTFVPITQIRRTLLREPPPAWPPVFDQAFWSALGDPGAPRSNSAG